MPRIPQQLVALVLIGALAGGCDDLPSENGVEWHCVVEAERGGLVVGGHPSDGALWICANPDVSPSDVIDQCEGDCEDKWCTYGITSSFPFITFCTDATCTWVGSAPTPSGVACEDGSDPGGPAKASLALTGQAVVSAEGESGTASGVTGLLRYSIADCGANACAIYFAELSLNVPTFDIDGYDITATIHNGINAEGVYYADTNTFEFAPGAVQIATNFTVDGDAGSTALANAQPVTGTLDPDTDFFSLAAGSFSQDDVTVDIISLTGVHTNRPPAAEILPESPVECNQTASAALVLDGSSSTDPDSNLERYEWRVDAVDVGTGALLPYELPLGSSDVELTAYDTLSAFDKTESTIEVVDTTAPALTPPPDIVAECESAAGNVLDIGEAVASDVCDDTIAVSSDAPAVYPPGQTTVTWVTDDSSGNVSQATQTVDIVDTTPPTLTLSLSPAVLAPPNHKLSTITATLTVSDICDAAPVVSLVSITSDEPDDGLGDGDAPNDVQDATLGTDDRTFSLRRERQGSGDGRVYTVTYRAIDTSGNTTEQVATVTVPK
jgi:hypothetical protein